MSETLSIPFHSPQDFQKKFNLIDGLEIEGMALAKGIHLIGGAGFHGKTTVLNALQNGIHPHIPGDGREFVCVLPETTKVQTESGRSINSVNLDCFFQNLPGNIQPSRFNSENASGSTSQGAAIVEAVQAGAKLLLVDEDGSAGNFMGRNSAMRDWIPDNEETIIPLVFRLKEFRDKFDVSWIMAMGSNGDYFQVADAVYRMRDFKIEDQTNKFKSNLQPMAKSKLTPIVIHKPIYAFPTVPTGKGFKVKTSGWQLRAGPFNLDMRRFEEADSEEQRNTIGYLLGVFAEQPGRLDLTDLQKIIEKFQHNDFSTLPRRWWNFSGVRLLDICWALNRTRGLQKESQES